MAPGKNLFQVNEWRMSFWIVKVAEPCFSLTPTELKMENWFAAPSLWDHSWIILFSSTLPPQNPKDYYFVGDKVEYTCTAGFYLLGNILECTPNQIWSASPGLCAGISVFAFKLRFIIPDNECIIYFFNVFLFFFSASVCKLPLLADGVRAFPLQDSYHLGETLSLSCPEGKELQGERTSSCDSSLNLSPDPTQVRCIQGIILLGLQRYSQISVKRRTTFVIILYQCAVHMVCLFLSHRWSKTETRSSWGTMSTMGETFQRKVCLQNAYRVQVCSSPMGSSNCFQNV